jgi:cyclophilin family peptidyl-prolyl cis-trans isomerase
MMIPFYRRFLACLTLGVVAGGCASSSPSGTPASTPPPPPAADNVLFSTSLGDFTVELYADKAPLTVANILKYVDAGFYDGVIFHRVIPGFVIQGGGMTSDMRQKATNPPVKNECGNGLRNLRGTLSMARTNDPNSATSQFFVNLVDNKSLDFDGPYGGYAVFGKVVAGMEVVDKIAAVRTGNSGMHQNVPAEPIVIKSAKRVK